MVICVKCEHKDINSPNCSNSELPITDFVYGKRDCSVLNPKGGCMGFKPQSQDESIYELKEDEELANTGKEKAREDLARITTTPYNEKVCQYCGANEHVRTVCVDCEPKM